MTGKGSSRAFLSRRVLMRLGWVAVLAMLASRAQANHGTILHDGSVDGQLLPTRETVVGVLYETLHIRFQYDHLASRPGYPVIGTAPRAYVRAKYELRNPTDKPVSLRLAFPVVAGRLRQEGPILNPASSSGLGDVLWLAQWTEGVDFKVLIDGEESAFKRVPFEELTRPHVSKWRSAILAWMNSDKIIARILRKPKTTDRDRKVLREHLVGARGFTKRQAQALDNRLLCAGEPRLPGRWDAGYVCYLYHFLYPSAKTTIAEAFDKWRVDCRYIDPNSGKLYDADGNWGQFGAFHLQARISFATYRVTLDPESTRTVEVRYNHLTNIDHEGFWSDHGQDYQFQYILRTAELWDDFGPIAVTVSIPESLKTAFSLPLSYAGSKDSFMRFEGSIERPKNNLLIGLSPKLKNADLVKVASANWMQYCLGWLRRYKDDPRGPWADDYLFEYAVWMDALRRSRNFEYYKKTRKGVESATSEEWDFLTGRTPAAVYEMIVADYPETTTACLSALALIELRYRDAAFDSGVYASIEADVEGVLQRYPRGPVTANAHYLLGLCRMRHGFDGARAAMESAVTDDAHWYVRQQGDWFCQVLSKARSGDERLLAEWAECEIRNGFKYESMRREYRRGKYVFPMNQRNGVGQYWRIYCAYRDNPLSYQLLKRICLDMERGWHSKLRQERGGALSELARRAKLGEYSEKEAKEVRRKALAALKNL